MPHPAEIFSNYSLPRKVTKQPLILTGHYFNQFQFTRPGFAIRLLGIFSLLLRSFTWWYYFRCSIFSNTLYVYIYKYLPLFFLYRFVRFFRTDWQDTWSFYIWSTRVVRDSDTSSCYSYHDRTTLPDRIPAFSVFLRSGFIPPSPCPTRLRLALVKERYADHENMNFLSLSL